MAINPPYPSQEGNNGYSYSLSYRAIVTNHEQAGAACPKELLPRKGDETIVIKTIRTIAIERSQSWG
ncbi:hypothetical protein [Pontibacter burrus]|uniref:Uncharacterized protein n=1 Tax=Pontibacter burrus TaxID=2704466 RepID=A0A6B3M198_9BACT|nr:hypothetical protein [Pontibacter burrus]NEM99407.1 hypothetical protein [Pontibacter burrus]